MNGKLETDKIKIPNVPSWPPFSEILESVWLAPPQTVISACIIRRFLLIIITVEWLNNQRSCCLHLLPRWLMSMSVENVMVSVSLFNNSYWDTNSGIFGLTALTRHVLHQVYLVFLDSYFSLTYLWLSVDNTFKCLWLFIRSLVSCGKSFKVAITFLHTLQN